MNAITINDLDPEARVRHIGLFVRDLYLLNGDTGPYPIRDETTTVTWDPDTGEAVFDLNGVELRVPDAALDDIGLLPMTVGEETP